MFNFLTYEGRINTDSLAEQALGEASMAKNLYHHYTVCLPNPPEKVDLSRCKAIAVDALDGEEVDQRFLDFFNYSHKAILNKGQGWFTCQHPLTSTQILEDWANGDRLIGLGFGKFTRYGMIDIDAGSPHHNEEGFKAIRWALEDIGINDTILNQSSDSTGWHLYFSFPKAIHTFSLACLLHQTMEMAGLSPRAGELELFPNRKSWGGKDSVTQYNRHRLPLQPNSGSYILGQDFLPYSDNISTFLDRLDLSAASNDFDLIESLAAEAKANYQPFQKKSKSKDSPFQPHGSAKQWKKELEEAIAAGWELYHHSGGLLGKKTMGLLGQIAEYGRVFLGIDNENQLANYIYDTAIACPGFIPYCRHAREGELRAWCARWAKSAMLHRYPYGSRKGGFKLLQAAGPTNEEKKADAMARIADAVTDFEESGREWPNTMRERRKLLAKLAHCSERTLAKPDYLPLWHPKHRTNEDDILIDSNLDTARDGEATQHRDHTSALTFELRIPALSSLSHHPVPPPAAGSCTKPTLTLIQQGTQPFTIQESVPIPENKMNNTNKPTTTPKLGDWLVEGDRRHILLRLQSVEGEGWCRCQDERERRLGLRGGLYWLPDLLPAPIAEVGEVDCA